MIRKIYCKESIMQKLEIISDGDKISLIVNGTYITGKNVQSADLIFSNCMNYCKNTINNG